jgi:uncharacterized membrane protein
VSVSKNNIFKPDPMTSDRITPAPPRREKHEEELEDGDIHLAMLAYVPVLCLVSLVLRKRLEFLSCHVRQGLVLFGLEIVAGMLYFLPLAGWQLCLVLATACGVTSVRGISKALAGEEWESPLVAAVVSFFHR